MNGQCDVKSIRRTDAQMKPHQVAVPVPDQISERKHADDQHDVEREKIRRERDEKICFCDQVGVDALRLDECYGVLDGLDKILP